MKPLTFALAAFAFCLGSYAGLQPAVDATDYPSLDPAAASKDTGDTGTLQVTIAPPDVVTAGAKWQVNGGTAQDSGTTLTLAVGASYTVSFADVAGWTTPTPQTVTVSANTLTTATGTYILAPPTPLTVTSVNPADAWIFGGVVAEIKGQNFATTAVVTFAGIPATVLDVATDGKTLHAIVPPYETPFSDANVAVDVSVANGVNPAPTDQDTFQNGFYYWQYSMMTEALNIDVISTAFIASESHPTANLALDSVPSTFGAPSLTLPIAGSVQVYGLVRATKGAARVGTNQITTGTTVAGAWNFGVHLYNTIPGIPATNAPGTPVLSKTNVNFDHLGTPAVLHFPLDGTGLTLGDLNKGVSIWAIDSDYPNYAVDSTAAETVAGSQARFESTVLPADTDPSTGPDTTALTSVNARVFDFSSFAIKAAPIPSSVLANNVQEVGGKGTGPISGGTLVKITSSVGGLAWVTVVFGSTVDSGQPAANFRHATLVTAPGTDEYEVDVLTPAYPIPAPVNIGIYLNSDLTTPAVVLKPQSGGFNYTVSPGCFGANNTLSGAPSSLGGDAVLLLSAALFIVGSRRQRRPSR